MQVQFLQYRSDQRRPHGSAMESGKDNSTPPIIIELVTTYINNARSENLIGIPVIRLYLQDRS